MNESELSLYYMIALPTIVLPFYTYLQNNNTPIPIGSGHFRTLIHPIDFPEFIFSMRSDSSIVDNDLLESLIGDNCQSTFHTPNIRISNIGY